MMIPPKRQIGISVIGIVIVLILVGALVAGLAPMLLTKNDQMVQVSDLQALVMAKTAIVSYALSKGSIPFLPGATSSCVQGVMPASTSPYEVLGVNNWGALGTQNPFCMDVNTALAGATTPIQLCQQAKNQLTTPGVFPRICQDSACSASAAAAFVLYSSGNDRIGNLHNSGAPTLHLYENDNHGIDNSAGAMHYDDQLVSYSLADLVSACANAGVL